MKICPFCAEEIQEAAVKCRFCGEGLDPNNTASEKVLADAQPALKSYCGPIILGVLTLIIVVGIFILLYVFLDRRCKKYTVTTRRVTAKRGIFTKTVDEVNIAHIRSMNVVQSLWGRLWNYGNIFIGTAGTAGVEVTIQGVSDPVTLKELIARQGVKISQNNAD